MTEEELSKYRRKIKESILHYLTDEWNNHKRGKAHKENIPLYDKDDGCPCWCDIDLDMIMEKVVKGIWSVNVDEINN